MKRVGSSPQAMNGTARGRLKSLATVNRKFLNQISEGAQRSVNQRKELWGIGKNKNERMERTGTMTIRTEQEASPLSGKKGVKEKSQINEKQATPQRSRRTSFQKGQDFANS